MRTQIILVKASDGGRAADGSTRQRQIKGHVYTFKNLDGGQDATVPLMHLPRELAGDSLRVIFAPSVEAQEKTEARKRWRVDLQLLRRILAFLRGSNHLYRDVEIDEALLERLTQVAEAEAEAAAAMDTGEDGSTPVQAAAAFEVTLTEDEMVTALGLDEGANGNNGEDNHISYLAAEDDEAGLRMDSTGFFDTTLPPVTAVAAAARNTVGDDTNGLVGVPTANGTPTAAVHGSSTFMSAWNKDLLGMAFPDLFPYGRGHPGDKRLTAVSEAECIRHYLYLSSRRFAGHWSFTLVSFDHLGSKRAMQSVFLRAKFMSSSDRRAVIGVTPDDLRQYVTHLQAQQAAVRRGDSVPAAADSHSATGARVLLKNITVTSSKFWGSNEERMRARTQAFSMSNRLGQFNIFATLNFDEGHSMKIQLLAGHFSAADVDAVIAGDLPKDNSWHKVAVEFPVFQAGNFVEQVELFFQHIVGWAANELTPKRYKGLFGPPRCYFSTTESQGRLRLHLHCLLAIHGLPTKLSDFDAWLGEHAASPFAERFAAMVESVLTTTISDPTMPQATPSSPAAPPSPYSTCDSCFSHVLGVIPSQAWRHKPTDGVHRAAPLAFKCTGADCDHSWVTSEMSGPSRSWGRRSLRIFCDRTGACVPTAASILQHARLSRPPPWPLCTVAEEELADQSSSADRPPDVVGLCAASEGSVAPANVLATRLALEFQCQLHNVRHNPTCFKNSGRHCRMRYWRDSVAESGFGTFRVKACSCDHCEDLHRDRRVCNCDGDGDAVCQLLTMRQLIEGDTNLFSNDELPEVYRDFAQRREAGSNWVVPHAPVLTHIYSCNHDIVYLTNSAVLFYTTKYTTKEQNTAEHQADLAIMSLARRVAAEQLHAANPTTAPLPPEVLARRRLASATTAHTSQQEIGSPMAALYLLRHSVDLPFVFASHSFVSFNLAQALAVLQQHDCELIVRPSRRRGQPDGEPEEEPEVERQTSHAQFLDYTYRPSELRELCLYSFFEKYQQRVPIPSSSNLQAETIFEADYLDSDQDDNDGDDEPRQQPAVFEPPFRLPADVPLTAGQLDDGYASCSHLLAVDDRIPAVLARAVLPYAVGHPQAPRLGVRRRDRRPSTPFFTPVILEIIGPRLPSRAQMASSPAKQLLGAMITLILFKPFRRLSDLYEPFLQQAERQGAAGHLDPSMDDYGRARAEVLRRHALVLHHKAFTAEGRHSPVVDAILIHMEDYHRSMQQARSQGQAYHETFDEDDADDYVQFGGGQPLEGDEGTRQPGAGTVAEMPDCCFMADNIEDSDAASSTRAQALATLVAGSRQPPTRELGANELSSQSSTSLNPAGVRAALGLRTASDGSAIEAEMVARDSTDARCNFWDEATRTAFVAQRAAAVAAQQELVNSEMPLGLQPRPMRVRLLLECTDTFQRTDFSNRADDQQAPLQVNLASVSAFFTLNEQQHRAFVLMSMAMCKSLARHHRDLDVGGSTVAPCAPSASDESVEELRQLLMYVGGPAGFGKSQIISAVQWLLAHFGFSPALVTCAFTGQAAAGVGGTTIDGLFNVWAESPTLSNDAMAALQVTLAPAQLLVVDEISMVSHSKLCAIDDRLRQLTGREDLPFGGKNLVLLGDFLQLPPVSGSGQMLFCGPGTNDRGAQRDKMARGCSLWYLFNTIVFLKENMRQARDPAYAELLHRLRTGQFQGNDLEIINRRVVSPSNLLPADLRTTCVSVGNDTRMAINNALFWRWAQTRHETAPILLAEAEVVLKSGENVHLSPEQQRAIRSLGDTACKSKCSQVIPLLPGVPLHITKNVKVKIPASHGHAARTHLLVANGTQCHLHAVEFTQRRGRGHITLSQQADTHEGHAIIRASPRIPTLLLKVDGQPTFPPIGDLPPGVFPLSPEMMYPKPAILTRMPFLSRISGFRQFPVVLGFAMTVHKVQGMSMDQIVVAEHHSPEPTMVNVNKPNMLYTCLSRSRTLAGVFLLQPITAAHILFANVGVGEFADELVRLEACEQAAMAFYPAPCPPPTSGPRFQVPRPPPPPPISTTTSPPGAGSTGANVGPTRGGAGGRARRGQDRNGRRSTGSERQTPYTVPVRGENGGGQHPRRGRSAAFPVRANYCGSMFWVPLLHDIVGCAATCRGKQRLATACAQVAAVNPTVWVRALQAYRHDFAQRHITKHQVHSQCDQHGYIGAGQQERFLYPPNHIVEGANIEHFGGQSNIDQHLFTELQQAVAMATIAAQQEN